MKKYLDLILCFFKIHKWKYMTNSKIFPNTHYYRCDRCGEITINYDTKNKNTYDTKH